MPFRLLTWKTAAVVLAGLLAGLVGFFWLRSYGYNLRLAFTDTVEALQRMGPWVFFGGMALLPAAGFPILFLYAIAGPAFAAKLGTGGVLAATGVALAANLALTYWLARFGFRPWLEAIVAQTRYKIPTLDARSHAELTVIVRITPGPPFFVQSYLLGLAGVRFGPYFLISWSICMSYAAGLIVFGEAVLHGKAGMMFLGLSGLVAAGLIVHLLRRSYGKKTA